MRSIDIHAHNVPRSVVNIRDGGDWHGFTVEKGGPTGRLFLTRGQRPRLAPPYDALDH